MAFAHVTGGAAVGEARGVRFESVYAGGMVGEAKHCFIGSVGGGEVSPGVPGGGLRVSEGVRRSLYSGEGVSVALSVVARDGSSVVLDDGDVRRVLRGRPVASEWSVDAVLGSCQLPRLNVAAWTWALFPRLSLSGGYRGCPIHHGWLTAP